MTERKKSVMILDKIPLSSTNYCQRAMHLSIMNLLLLIFNSNEKKKCLKKQRNL